MKHHTGHTGTAHRHHGFSLLEVLVALLLISIGLLGIAKMQALAMGNTKNANSRAIAASYAASLAASMHANRGYWSTVPNTSTVTIAVTGTTITATSAGTSTLDQLVSTSNRTTLCVTASCSPIQTASFDLKNWGNDVSTSLPSGRGIITLNQGTGLTPLTGNISIFWFEKYNALNSTTSSGTATSTQSLTLMITP